MRGFDSFAQRGPGVDRRKFSRLPDSLLDQQVVEFQAH